MKESVGSTVDFNIIIVFIVIVFAFLSAALIYFKSNKVNNVISSSIEKYEGFNRLAEDEIFRKLNGLGYTSVKVSCEKTNDDNCNEVSENGGDNGYCVYYCEDGEYYYYKIKTRMLINLPIINSILNIPVYSNTDKMFDFEKSIGH